MKAVLVLEDGTAYHGEAIGSVRDVGGEVVFNTSMTGYQEVLTDPAYRGQLVVMTYPLVGNYGVNAEDGGADVHVQGIVVRELCSTPSNWRSQEGLAAFLERQGVTGIQGVDTRALTRHLREHGTMRGVIAPAGVPVAELAERARRVQNPSERDLVREVTTPEPYLFADGSGPEVVVVDLGVNRSLLRALADRGCKVRVVPADTAPETILEGRPAGVLLSSGPGDPRQVSGGVERIRTLLGELPIMGIGLGHQLLGLAMGARTYKLKYGHRGGNQPVQDLESGRSYITTQNHSYAIDAEGLEQHDVIVTHKNLNDGTVEGVRHRHLPAFSVQFHPEGAPGPADSGYLIDRFLDMIAPAVTQ